MKFGIVCPECEEEYFLDDDGEFVCDNCGGTVGVDIEIHVWMVKDPPPEYPRRIPADKSREFFDITLSEICDHVGVADFLEAQQVYDAWVVRAQDNYIVGESKFESLGRFQKCRWQH